MMKKFEKEYLIRTYECDKNENLRLVTCMNIFQDAADTHASSLGLGLEFCLQSGLAWVASNYHIKIKRLPKLHEKIRLKTWSAVEKKIGAIRDFEVFDENNEKIIVASSQWILIDFEKKRPVSLKDNLPHYQIIEERSLDANFSKIEDLQNVDCKVEFMVRFDDIDFNNHVNNAVYALWASEAVDKEWRLGHHPFEVEISFKKEGKYGEKVVVSTQMIEDVSIHSIKSTNDERELAKAKIRWLKD